jgi:heme-degrading monooxygenase HmoA
MNIQRKETTMQHVRMAVYTFKAGTADEVIRRAEAGAFPLFRSQPGFVGYGLIKTSDASGISLSIWQTPEQAKAAVQVAASWVKENVAELIESVQNHVGDLSFFSSTGALGS